MGIDVLTPLASNAALGTVLGIVLLMLVRANRSFLRDVARDDEAAWRGLAWLAAVGLAAFVAWVAVADDWRQLLDEPLRRSQRFPSDRVLFDPTPDRLRTVTLVLLVLSLLLLAPLVARHLGGYGTQLVLLVGCAFLWVPAFVLRHRLDVGLATGGEGATGADLGGLLLYILVDWTAGVAAIVLAYLALLMAVALPVTVLLDLVGRRSPRDRHDADGFFAALGDRATSR